MSGPPTSATPSSNQSSNSLTVYEQERQKNIEKNKAVLAELGLGDARRQLIETHKKDVVEKIKRRYTKKSFVVDTPRRSARIQGKPVRYSDGFGSDEGEEDRKLGIINPNTSIVSFAGGNIVPTKRKYSFYDIEEDVGSRPKYKNELTTCHFCRKRDRKPKTRCSACGIKYWVGDCCRSCFEQHFEEEDFDEVMMDKNWVCYCCRKKCPCLECIAGITKGRRYGPRKFKDSQKDDYCAPASFSAAVPEQFSLFQPLPLPSFLNYNSQASNGIPQFNFPMLPQPNHFASPPSPTQSPPLSASNTPPSATASSSSSGPFSHHTGYTSYPTPSLFGPHSNYSGGGFPSFQSSFGGGTGSGMSGVSPQNMFNMSPLSLPPPLPSQQSSHQFMPSSPYLNSTTSSSTRDGSSGGESLGNGAMCGYKMAQVIAQITNAPSGYGSYMPPSNMSLGLNMNSSNINNNNNSNNNNINANANNYLNSYTTSYNNNYLNSNLNSNYINSYSNSNYTNLLLSNNLVTPMKKRGRKPKGFNFALHAESVSSDPMSSNDAFEEPLDILPPIKIPKRRGRKPKNTLPALSVEEEAMSIGMANAVENIDSLSGDPPTPVLSPALPLEKKKRGRPKSTDPHKNGSTKIGGRTVMPKKRGRKPKTSLMLPSPLSPSSELSTCTPSPNNNPVHFDMNGDEFFNTSGNDILNYDDEIFNEIDDLGITPFHTHTTTSLDDELNSDSPLSELPHMCGSGGSENGESLKLRLKVPGMHIPPLIGLHKKRGRKPKKLTKLKLLSMKESGDGNIGLGGEKRKYTKRKHAKDAEDTSNLRRSARPPQASRAFDDHYLL